MALPLLAGGWGQIAWGQHEVGAGQSTVEPRFNWSQPSDGKQNVPRDSWLEFEVYYFSSFPADVLDNPAFFEISEDGGQSYVSAEAAPYTLLREFIGGHILWVKIVKTGLWTASAEVVIRTTLPDEFGQAITKELPTRWST